LSQKHFLLNLEELIGNLACSRHSFLLLHLSLLCLYLLLLYILLLLMLLLLLQQRNEVYLIK
jgi:hypothetical protein